jgi:hypothetical protein
MSKRTYEDVERERMLAKISRDTEEIKNKLDPPTDGSWIFSAILGGIGSLFRPLRRLIPYRINRIIDYAATMAFFISGAVIFGWYDGISVRNGIIIFVLCGLIFVSSPFHDKY